ncbi:MAG: twin-arginine translocase TatA/TatE family subunit [Myxococcota bacterium]|nr:twin-arginine translocase TatA/TatE family subunit [Myxococcota bacterium]
MLNLGLTEILVILVVAIVVVGPERLPTVVRWLGRQYGKLMRASDELRRAFVIEADRAEAEARAEDLRKRREIARKRIEAARASADPTTPQPRSIPSPPVSEDTEAP